MGKNVGLLCIVCRNELPDQQEINLISEEEIDKALNFLRDNSPKIGKLKAEMEYLQEFSKVILAEEMAKSADKPVNAQERDARASERFKLNLEAIRTATEEYITLYYLMKAADTKISAWQTIQATERALGKI